MGFLMTNKTLNAEIGLEASGLLSELLDRRDFYRKCGKLELINGIEYFYATGKTIEKATRLSYKVQLKILKELEKLGFVSIEVRGMPAKRFFAINDEVIENFISDKSDKVMYQNDEEKAFYKDAENNKPLPDGRNKLCQKGTTGYSKKEQLDVTKGNTNKELNKQYLKNDIININNNNKENFSVNKDVPKSKKSNKKKTKNKFTEEEIKNAKELFDFLLTFLEPKHANELLTDYTIKNIVNNGSKLTKEQWQGLLLDYLRYASRIDRKRGNGVINFITFNPYALINKINELKAENSW